MNKDQLQELSDLMNMAKGNLEEAKHYLEEASKLLRAQEDDFLNVRGKSLWKIAKNAMENYWNIDSHMKDMGMKEC